MEFDYVVVGAGSAGCAVANRLSECGNYRVALIEAGPSDNSPWIHVPVGTIEQWVILNPIGVTKHNQTEESQIDPYPGQEEGLWVDLAQLTVFFTFGVSLEILTFGLNLVVMVGLGMKFCHISSVQKIGMVLMKLD